MSRSDVITLQGVPLSVLIYSQGNVMSRSDKPNQVLAPRITAPLSEDSRREGKVEIRHNPKDDEEGGAGQQKTHLHHPECRPLEHTLPGALTELASWRNACLLPDQGYPRGRNPLARAQNIPKTYFLA